MSRWLEIQSRRARAAADRGFTVIELVVAITLLALVAAGAVPLLVIGMKAANASKLHTQAKNLAQARLESMRDMQFHVDRQNGPFVDMLDVYFTDLTTTATTRVRGSETMVGKYISSGASSPEPSGALYQVKIAALPSDTRFSQTIDTQFLTDSGTAMSASALAGYNSQVEGQDSPPSLIVGVTVITSWSDHGSTHSYSTYTRITESRGTSQLLTTQGTGEYLRLASATPSGSPITVDVGLAQADGSTTTGSSATATDKGVYGTDGAGTSLLGAYGLATSPSAGGSTTTPVLNLASGGTGCGWLSASNSQVGNVTATTTGGLPKVPTTIDTATPPANQTYAGLGASSSGAATCGLFSFGNQSTSYDSSLLLDATYPLVRIPNVSGNALIASGSAWINATDATTSPHSVSSGAGASGTQQIQLFPGATFLPANSGKGLVNITLTSSRLACASTSTAGTGVAQSASGAWSATVEYYTTTGWVTKNFTWDSSTGSGSTDPLAAINPSSITVYQNGATTLTLANFISSWSTTRSITESTTSGLHQLPGVVNIATRPVRTGDTLSGLSVVVGDLSCAADDNR